jgi:hypothetical protein
LSYYIEKDLREKYETETVIAVPIPK